MSRWSHHWTCPRCANEHRWSWPAEDRPDLGEEVWMLCEACGQDTLMAWRGPGRGWQRTEPAPGSPGSPFRND